MPEDEGGNLRTAAQRELTGPGISFKMALMNPQVWAAASVSVLIFVSLAFLPAALLRRNDIADILWGPGFLVAGIAGWRLGFPERNADPRLLLLLALLTIWASRLSLHILNRWLGHAGEDPRYLQWRREWGATWIWRSYLQVFVLQGLLLLLVDAPLLWVVGEPARPLDACCAAGTLLWIFGFVFEAVGDEQLRQFRRNSANRGRLLTTGLWAWSRHPNYFGEVVQWWGLAAFSVTLPAGWVTLVSPALITFLILKVSGVPMLEKLLDGRPGAEEYRRRTSVFFPRPPRR